MPGLADSPRQVPLLGDLQIRPARIGIPDSLATFATDSLPDRASHAYGKAFRDVVRSLDGQLENPPDLVAYPASEQHVVDVLDWANSANVVVVPFGGGSSVVGGVECRDDDRPVVALDMTRMDRVLEVDPVSLAARIQGGALGPVLEDQLRGHGFTLRHFPQSFEFSTLGGWIATRAGGHYATLHTHIDDFVESIRSVTPVGISESWRLPGSGAGPSPDRLMLGSEGILGVITEAWMRIQRRPRFKASRSVRFADRSSAFGAVRAIAQSGLHPANCRLLDPGEAALSGASTRGEWVLVLGVESAHQPVEGQLADLATLAHDHGGIRASERPSSGGLDVSSDATSDAVSTGRDAASDGSSSTGPGAASDAASDAWRSAFLRMPYVRDGLARMGAIVETFETAMTWDRVDELYVQVNERLGEAIREITGAPGLINCRFTHVYPDGAAPYFTVIAAAAPGGQLAMWDELKDASMEILTGLRATVTHHHAVGRDHRPGYDRQRPEPFAVALRAAKAAVDPSGILNPGVLVDPLRG